jgi:hypothetical protein
MTDTRSSDFARQALAQAERTAREFPDTYRKAIVGQARETLEGALRSERNAPAQKGGKP